MLWRILKAILSCILVHIASLMTDHPPCMCSKPTFPPPPAPPPPPPTLPPVVINLQVSFQASNCPASPSSANPPQEPPPNPSAESPEPVQISPENPVLSNKPKYSSAPQPPPHPLSSKPSNQSLPLSPKPQPNQTYPSSSKNMPSNYSDLLECPMQKLSGEQESSQSKTKPVKTRMARKKEQSPEKFKIKCPIKNTDSDICENVLRELVLGMKIGNMYIDGWDETAIHCICAKLVKLLDSLLLECVRDAVTDYEYPT